MFGYVRPNPDTLPEEAKTRYEAVYCGLCQTMGKRYGGFSRLFLNYDFALLAMLLASPDEQGETGCPKCPRHPIEGKTACETGPWLERAAGESVILTYWKLWDTVADSGFFAGLSARFARLLLRRGYQKARRAYPDFDRQVSALLKELDDLEKENCSQLDQVADCFARLLRAAAPAIGKQERDRPLEQLLYHLGRWIYLIDAVDDLEEDRQSGRYSPVLARFPQWSEEDKTYLRQLLDQSLNLMGAAFQLLERNVWSPTVENIVYSGLPGVETLVFSGQWREHQKRHRRNDL